MDTFTDDPGRRRFLARIIKTVQAFIGGSVGVILGGAVISPVFARRSENWLTAASLGDLRDNEPMPVTVRAVRDDGYAQIVDRQVIFLVKTSESEVTALSSTCTHLGCRVSWIPDVKELRCPCHGGIYDMTGAVVSGPPPAPLARIATKVEGDQVLVQV